MRDRTIACSWLFPALGLFAALGAGSCSNGGSGGGGGPAAVTAEAEPNDTSAQATALGFGRYGSGEVGTAADLDLWSVALSAGSIVQVEVFGTRLDQSNWDFNGTVPRLTLYGTDGTTKLLEHDYSGNDSDGWSWGAHDLDFPAYRIPASGTYFVGVTQDDTAVGGGDYAIRVKAVSLPAPQVETEAVATTGVNDTAVTAQAITPGTIRGFHVDGESDYYSFVVASPSIVRFDLKAYRNGVFGGDDNYYDPEISLYEADGTTSIDSNDDTHFYDSALHHRFTTPGTYFIEVTECCGAGDAAYYLSYTRTVGVGTVESETNETPATADSTAYGRVVTGSTDTGDVDVFAFQGTAGDMVRIQFFDEDNKDSATDTVDVDLLGPDEMSASYDYDGGLQVLRAILPASGTWYVSVTAGAATDYAFEVTRYKTARFESEDNGTTATADGLDKQNRAAGVIDLAPLVGAPTDVDLFAFSVLANRLWTAVIYASNSSTDSDGESDLSGHGSDLDPLISILDSDGNVVASSTSQPLSIYTESVVDGLPTAAVSFIAPATGRYYVRVEDAQGNSGPSYLYVIEVR